MPSLICIWKGEFHNFPSQVFTYRLLKQAGGVTFTSEAFLNLLIARNVQFTHDVLDRRILQEAWELWSALRFFEMHMVGQPCVTQVVCNDRSVCS